MHSQYFIPIFSYFYFYLFLFAILFKINVVILSPFILFISIIVKWVLFSILFKINFVILSYFALMFCFVFFFNVKQLVHVTSLL